MVSRRSVRAQRTPKMECSVTSPRNKRNLGGAQTTDRYAESRTSRNCGLGRIRSSIQVARMAAVGASFALLRLPATVPSLIISLTFRPVGCGGCACPIADARLASRECLLVGVKPSDQASAPFFRTDPHETLRAITVGVGWARRPRRSDDGTASTPPCPRDWHSARLAGPSAWAKADPK